MAATYRTPIPDFIKLGIIKRKLTRKEAAKITREIMAMKIEDPHFRCSLAIIKAMEVTSKSKLTKHGKQSNTSSN